MNVPIEEVISVLDLKRKPNERHSLRATISTAALLGYESKTAEARVNHSNMQPASSSAAAPSRVPIPKQNGTQMRTPVITGEAYYKGMLPIDGMLMGQIGANGGSLGIKQKSHSAFGSGPELSGEISFRDVLRVNGHIAGTVYSQTGTLIIDDSAVVDANIEAGTVVISGTVHGDIVAHQRVELSISARIYGNIWTRSIAIKDGAIFDGVCTMIDKSDLQLPTVRNPV